MLKHVKWLSGLALASLCTVAVPGVFPQSAAQALTLTTASATQPTRSNRVARIQHSSRIRVVYGDTDDPLSAALMQGYRENRFFEEIGQLITSEINLPRDITVVVKDCGQANAYYSPNEHAIVICNELTKENYQVLRKHGYGEDEALQTAVYASVFFFYHESGHMLIHELNLPTVGKEEDVADQFSAVFLLLNDPSSHKSLSGEILLSAAKLFQLQRSDLDPEILKDPHALNQQRFYNIVCLLYGSAPEQYSKLVAKLDYPESRQNSCREESETIVSAWKRLLQAHLKT